MQINKERRVSLWTLVILITTVVCGLGLALPLPSAPFRPPQAQPTLQITSPSPGTIVNPGQSLTVSVTSNSPNAFQGAAIISDDPIGFFGTVSALPGQIAVPIPTSGISCGTHTLAAESTPTSGTSPVFAYVQIDVERPDFPVAMSPTLSGLHLESLGEQVQVELLADFSDGSTFQITQSSYIAYSSSSAQIATVSPSGVVTAVSAGSAAVTATYTFSGQSSQISMPVFVSAPKLAVSPSTLMFASQSMGTSSPAQQLTLTNLSPDNISVLGVTAAGDFSETDNCIASSPLGASSSCTANVTFSPTAAGTRTGTLSIANSANLVPISISLSGTGTTAPAITGLSPTSGAVGTSVTISGANFGAAQGTSTVTFNGVAASPTSWAATSIVTSVPTGATTGNVVVTVTGTASNGVTFTVTNGIQLVQHKSIDAGTTTSASLAFASNNTSGNWIAVCIRAGLSSSQVFTVSDSRNNTYHKAVQLGFTSNAVTMAIYYAENVGAGANTVEVSDTVNGPLRFAIFEYSGVATSNSLDVTTTEQGTSASPHSETFTTTASGDLLLVAVGTVDAESFSAGSGYAGEEFVPAEPNTKLIAQDQIQSTAGNTSATASLGASDPWGLVVAAFKKP